MLNLHVDRLRSEFVNLVFVYYSVTTIHVCYNHTRVLQPYTCVVILYYIIIPKLRVSDILQYLPRGFLFSVTYDKTTDVFGCIS